MQRGRSPHTCRRRCSGVDRSASSGDNGTYLWDLADSDPRSRTISILESEASAFHPEDPVLATADRRGRQLTIRNLETGERLDRDDVQGIRRVQFSPDGEWLATASLDGVAVIWETEDFLPVHFLVGHVDQVLTLHFHPSRPELVTASSDGSVKFWDVETGELRMTIPGLFAEIDFSPEGRYLAGGGPESAISVYYMDGGELAEATTRRLTRWWTETECRRFLDTPECPDPPQHLQGT